MLKLGDDIEYNLGFYTQYSGYVVRVQDGYIVSMIDEDAIDYITAYIGESFLDIYNTYFANVNPPPMNRGFPICSSLPDLIKFNDILMTKINNVDDGLRTVHKTELRDDFYEATINEFKNKIGFDSTDSSENLTIGSNTVGSWNLMDSRTWVSGSATDITIGSADIPTPFKKYSTPKYVEFVTGNYYGK